MASAQVLTFVVVVFLGAFSGSALDWFPWPSPGNIETQPAESCRDVYTYYTSCENFIVGDSPYPPQECCSGLSILDQISKDEANGSGRICQCIEAIAARGGHPPYSESRINDLYDACNVHLSFPISEHMDCSLI